MFVGDELPLESTANHVMFCYGTIFPQLERKKRQHPLFFAVREISPPNTVYLPSASAAVHHGETDLTREANQ